MRSSWLLPCSVRDDGAAYKHILARGWRRSALQSSAAAQDRRYAHRTVYSCLPSCWRMDIIHAMFLAALYTTTSPSSPICLVILHCACHLLSRLSSCAAPVTTLCFTCHPALLLSS